MTPTPLPHIVALARAGALEQASRLFAASGYDRDASPGALAVKGRLLKDRALRASGEARRGLYEEAARAYAEAAGTERSTYPLINAATLSLLAGDPEGAKLFAADVLRRIEEEPDEPETPYYRLATTAEALLLMGREAEARHALTEAVTIAPRAWEDHASTLRQFGLILGAQQGDSTWLDALRPPRSLHFAGHMSFGPHRSRPDLVAGIEAVLDEERAGFGYGALAAGADIIVAEALLARGAELHLVLPGGAEAFALRSVDPYGAEWRARFDAVLERAETVRGVRPLGEPPGAAAIALADEAAMGAALMNARRLASEAVQLLVSDPAGDAPASASRWIRGGGRQRLVPASREAVSPGDGHEADAGQSCRTLAVLAVAVEEGEDSSVESRLATLKQTFATLPPPAVAPYWAVGQVVTAYAEPADAAEAAVSLAGAGWRAGADYCVAEAFRDPFSDSERLAPAATAAARAAAASAPPGSACVTEDFANALAVAGPGAPVGEYIGELDSPDGAPPLGLYALRPL